MTNLTPDEREKIGIEATELEQQISALVGAFEEKHKPLQIVLRARWFSPGFVYNKERGGAVQLTVIDGLRIEEYPQVSEDILFVDSDGKGCHLIVAK